ncbi:MAG TPA: class II aldolase/adducin family protein [Acidimicrobiales bacterium]|nr:class II aldolase/adducin family protein [Acidimicrobiales bacterium]
MLEGERQQLVDQARRLRPDGLVVGASGNLSMRCGELVAVTPSAVDYDALEPDLICVVELDGSPVEGALGPTTELPMHLAVYQRTSAAAVVHTHSPYATVLATVMDVLPPIHYLIATLGGPVRVAPYATPGTEELADTIVGALGGRSGVLLQNHGALTTGESLEEAYSRSVTLEWLCALHYRATLFGEPRVLSDEELNGVAPLMETYGRSLRR